MAFSDQPARLGGGIVAALVGFGAVQLLGANLLVPMVLCGIAGFALFKLRPLLSQPMQAGLALFIGHTAWMLLGGLIVPQQLAGVIIDIIVGVALIAWMLAKTSRVAVWLTLAFEALGLAMNALFLVNAGGGWTPMASALTVHLLLRLGIIASFALALKQGLLAPQAEADDVEEVFS